MTVAFTIRHATPDDIEAIKRIADRNKDALGFLPWVKVRDATKAKRIMVLEAGALLIGFVIYRHRKIDRQTTLGDICIADKWRGYQGGRLLIEALYNECVTLKREFISLKCPEDLPANQFYERVGFRHERTETGRVRQLNVWRLDINGTKTS